MGSPSMFGDGSMTRVYNFSAGPAVLPQAVLAQAQAELLDWQGSGMSVMEVSHRGKAFVATAEQAEADLRELLAIPANYKVLFLQGGAYGQFSMVPLNLLGTAGRADYVDTGIWSQKAISEARRYGQVKVVASSVAQRYTTVPAVDTWQCDPQAAYLHYTPNETINGLEFDFIPDSGEVPLVADMSSTILSRPIDVSRFGVIYAGAQKNIGPSGLVVVIVREDLLDRAHPHTPSAFSYAQQAANGSMLNTPPTFAWYLAGLIFQWLKAEGGLQAIGERNQRKATALYNAIDHSGGFYHNAIEARYRSWMNVPFTLADERLEKPFLSAAAAAGLHNLAGHRSVGGMRASIYNAMPESGVQALVEFMAHFQQQHA